MEYSSHITVIFFIAIAFLLAALMAPLLFALIFGDRSEVSREDECGEISLTWSAAERAETYRLSRDGEVVYEGGGLEYMDTSLVLGEQYTYRVQALNAGGESEYSEERTFTIERRCPPEPPDRIHVEDSECGGSVRISWSAPAQANSYEVTRRTQPGLLEGLLQRADEEYVYEGGFVHFYEDGLEPGARYVYKVRAGNETGWSEDAERVVRASSVCPPERPEPPASR